MRNHSYPQRESHLQSDLLKILNGVWSQAQKYLISIRNHEFFRIVAPLMEPGQSMGIHGAMRYHQQPQISRKSIFYPALLVFIWSEKTRVKFKEPPPIDHGIPGNNQWKYQVEELPNEDN